MTLLWLLLGLALVILGGDLFVRAAVGMAEILRMPRVIIGGTLMSLATTTPEVAVSVVSSLRGEPGLAVGNAVGSVMCNVGLIAGTMAMLSVVRVRRRDVLDAMVMLAVTSLILLSFAVGGSLWRWEGWVLVVLGVIYFAGDFFRSLLNRSAVKEREAATIEELHHPPRSVWMTSLLFAVGGVLVVGGSRLLVDSAAVLAERVGVSPLIIGATIVAIGTSLPEYVTAVLSVRKGVADLSVGNIIGANIANLTLVAGSAALHTPVPLSRADLYLNFPALFVIIGVLAFGLLVRGQMGRAIGAILIAIYATYVTLIVLVPGG